MALGILISLQALENLKVLDLNGCRSLTQIPDLSRAPNLEDLDITFCSNVDKFPVLPNPCKIKYLRMTATKIKEVPPSINCLARVIIWTLDCCYRLKSLPTSICELKFLKILALEESSKFEDFPEILEPMERLEQLLLDITGIRKLPLSIENLIGLKTLSLQHCESLEVIPCTIYNMSLEHLNLYGCKKLKRLPELPFSLKHLNATGCDSLEMVSNPWIALAQHPRDYIVEQEFHFPECSKLDNNNIVTEFQIRVLAPAILTKSEPDEKKVHFSSFFCLCYFFSFIYASFEYNYSSICSVVTVMWCSWSWYLYPGRRNSNVVQPSISGIFNNYEA